LNIFKIIYVGIDFLKLAEQILYIPVYFTYETEEIVEIVTQLKDEYDNSIEKDVIFAII